MATTLKKTNVAIIGLGAAGGVACLPLAQAGKAAERLLFEPVLGALRTEVTEKQLNLARHCCGADGHVDIGLAEVTIPLGNLVFEYKVIAERVPGELAREPVILMEIQPRVSEDEIRFDRLELLEACLHRGAVVGEEALAVLEDPDIWRADAFEKCISTRSRLVCTHAVRGQHDPGHV